MGDDLLIKSSHSSASPGGCVASSKKKKNLLIARLLGNDVMNQRDLKSQFNESLFSVTIIQKFFKYDK